jgi:hypothetical protein
MSFAIAMTIELRNPKATSAVRGPPAHDATSAHRMGTRAIALSTSTATKRRHNEAAVATRRVPTSDTSLPPASATHTQCPMRNDQVEHNTSMDAPGDIRNGSVTADNTMRR